MSGLEWLALFATIAILSVINGFVWLYVLLEILKEV
jgi:hypothetical protein